MSTVLTQVEPPQTARGFRDIEPRLMLMHERVMDKARAVSQRYGHVPLQTPAVEYLSTLLGSAGAEAQQSMFRVSNPHDELLGLRFDLTVSLARFIATNPTLPRPFRRYQAGQVWRADKPDKGRYSEFTQFDTDSVGVESEVGDTEVIAWICDVLDAVGVGRYMVKFSSRAILNLLLDFAGIPHEIGIDVFRVLDKLDKIGLGNVRNELMQGYTDKSGAFIEGLGLRHSQVDRIEVFLRIRADTRVDVLLQLRDLFAHVRGAREVIDGVERISSHLTALGYGDERVSLDLSIARGLAYYTGPVFEAVIPAAQKFGSVAGGGRYDDLVRRFGGDRIPATGASIGVDRLVAVLAALERIESKKSTASVLIANLDPSLTSDYIAMAWELRRAGIATELYLGPERAIGKQLKYANENEVPLTLLYGSTEKEQGIVTLKDMTARRGIASRAGDREEWLAARSGQSVAPRTELVATVNRLLAEFSEIRGSLFAERLCGGRATP